MPPDVPAEQMREWIAQELERWSRKRGWPADLEYMRQCGYWVQHREPYWWRPGTPESRDWYMELGGYPVYSVDVEYGDDGRITVYHWKGDHPNYSMGGWQQGNLAFDGVRREFKGEIATRGF